MTTILVIEDDADLRLTLKRLLQSHDFNVLDASDGRKGLNACGEHDVDLVITDIFMPEVEGLQTIITLKENFPMIKVIAISGGGKMQYTEVLESTVEFGADRAFKKPVDMDVLLDALNQLLKN